MKRSVFNKCLAVFMLLAGVGMAVAGFIVPPTGEISPSVLMFTAQTFIFAGSAVGIDVMIERKLAELKKGDGK